jgi:sec-independent protein translocase protein TatC
MAEEAEVESAAKLGRMPLTDHLRELRTRLYRSLIAIAIGAVVGWVYYDAIFAAISAPFEAVVDEAVAQGRTVTLALTGVADPFVLKLKVAGVAGVVLASPIWIYQLWRFVTPGLKRHERKWSILFVAVATPLFLAGALLAYVFLPNALGFLFDFTPQSVDNIVDVSKYVSFFLRTVIMFGIGFLLPLFALMLNLAGVLPARALIRAWRWVMLGIVVFAAVATPDGNPLTMGVMAAPIIAMIGVVMGIAYLNDRRKGRKNPDLDLRDDELSSIETDSDTP